MKNIARMVIVIVLCSAALGQAPDTVWTNRYGGTGNDEAEDFVSVPGGGWAILGITQSFPIKWSYYDDLYVVRTGRNSDTLWTHVYSAPENQDAVTIDAYADGGLLIAGVANSYDSEPESQWWIIRTDANGEPLWDLYYGEWDRNWPSRAIAMPDGGAVVYGSMISEGSVAGTTRLLRLDANGQVLWFRDFHGVLSGLARNFTRTADGGFCLGAYLEDPGDGRTYLIRTDSLGNELWRSELTFDIIIGISGLHETADGGFVFTGNNIHGWAGHDIYVAKTDPLGNVSWLTRFEDSGDQWPFAVRETPDHGFFVVGSSSQVSGQPFVMRLNSDGDTLWTDAYVLPRYTYLTNVEITPYGSYILAGGTRNPSTFDYILLETEEESVVGREVVVIKDFSVELYPNPFNATTVFSYELPWTTKVDVGLYDILGQRIASLTNEMQSAGTHRMNISREGLASGVYLVRLEAGEHTLVRKAVVVK